ncbi:hypothetical protein [Ekhidna sp.]|uniref:hypothetical protein n=1 Tax=Ekhidna sp. TaxID=2608089 RepID=UPI003B51371E
MSSLLISEAALSHWIENFYGYGSWEAPIWFINHEEPSGDMPEEVADKLNYFIETHAEVNSPTLCDPRALYKQVRFTPQRSRADIFSNLYDYRFGPNAVQRGEWKGIISLVHGYNNQPISDAETCLEYQCNSLATGVNNEALLRLYPLPAHSHAWYYSWLNLKDMDFLKSRTAYQEHVYEVRMQAILEQIRIYHPKLVIMYDMKSVNTLKESIQRHFSGVKFTTVKAIPHKIPPHHVSRLTETDTTIVITTQSTGLRHNRPETGFDWETFGRALSVK